MNVERNATVLNRNHFLYRVYCVNIPRRLYLAQFCLLSHPTSKIGFSVDVDQNLRYYSIMVQDWIEGRSNPVQLLADKYLTTKRERGKQTL